MRFKNVFLGPVFYDTLGISMDDADLFPHDQTLWGLDEEGKLWALTTASTHDCSLVWSEFDVMTFSEFHKYTQAV